MSTTVAIAALSGFLQLSFTLAFQFCRTLPLEPRAAATGSHKTAGRVGSICLLDGRSSEFPAIQRGASAPAADSPAKRRATGRNRRTGVDHVAKCGRQIPGQIGTGRLADDREAESPGMPRPTIRPQ
jgi:hypothetical protein